MRVLPLLALLCAVSVPAAASGCKRDHFNHPVAPPGANGGYIAYGLGAEDADKRKDAAEDLREDDGPPPDAVPHLIAALQREQDKDAYAEMLITLGASGSPDARPLLETNLQNPVEDIREAAEKGFKLWSKRTGQAAPQQMPKAVAKLQSRDWEDRRDAAEDLRDDGGPPAIAVPHLIAAAQKETAPKALGAMLITLGASGAPEAKPLIEARVNDPDPDMRRWARKGMKNWQAKNGERVRQDVSTPALTPPPATTGPAAAPPPQQGPDGCDQFKTICAADPFDLQKCKADLKVVSYPQQQVWADCINSSTDPCQKAHDGCMTKAKATP